MNMSFPQDPGSGFSLGSGRSPDLGVSMHTFPPGSFWGSWGACNPEQRDFQSWLRLFGKGFGVKQRDIHTSTDKCAGNHTVLLHSLHPVLLLTSPAQLRRCEPSSQPQITFFTSVLGHIADLSVLCQIFNWYGKNPGFKESFLTRTVYDYFDLP